MTKKGVAGGKIKQEYLKKSEHNNSHEGQNVKWGLSEKSPWIHPHHKWRSNFPFGPPPENELPIVLRRDPPTIKQ